MSKNFLLVGLASLALAFGCEREQRRFSGIAPFSGRPQPLGSPELQAGQPGAPQSDNQATPRLSIDEGGLFGGNAWAISEGKRLYVWFICVGCHGHGGGGMGPPLMDAEWIYGSEPENVYATIVNGRPNGMPAFGGKLPEQQIWQLVAYVRSLGRLTRKGVRPGRNDNMAVRPSEQAMEAQSPRRGNVPPKAKESAMIGTLDPAGPQAAHIAGLWWWMFGVFSMVFVAVLVALLVALWRRSVWGVTIPPPQPHPDSTTERRVGWVVAIAVVVTTVVLLAFLTANAMIGQRVAHLATEEGSIDIELTGYRRWWKVQYPNPTPALQVTTANEIHIPVGRPILINLRSPDVIHSFWIPALHGKRDLIPGHPTSIWLKADRPGKYEGQCAEFCGLQHAHMRLLVMAEPEEKFQAWLAAQRQTAQQPSDAIAQRGLEIFETGPCALCHSIKGTQLPDRWRPISRTLPAGRRSVPARCRIRPGIWQAGSSIRSTSSPATPCRRTVFHPKISGRCSRTSESSRERRARDRQAPGHSSQRRRVARRAGGGMEIAAGYSRVVS